MEWIPITPQTKLPEDTELVLRFREAMGRQYAWAMDCLSGQYFDVNGELVEFYDIDGLTHYLVPANETGWKRITKRTRFADEEMVFRLKGNPKRRYVCGMGNDSGEYMDHEGNVQAYRTPQGFSHYLTLKEPTI